MSVPRSVAEVIAVALHSRLHRRWGYEHRDTLHPIRLRMAGNLLRLSYGLRGTTERQDDAAIVGRGSWAHPFRTHDCIGRCSVPENVISCTKSQVVLHEDSRGPAFTGTPLCCGGENCGTNSSVTALEPDGAPPATTGSAAVARGTPARRRNCGTNSLRPVAAASVTGVRWLRGQVGQTFLSVREAGRQECLPHSAMPPRRGASPGACPAPLGRIAADD